MLRCHCKACRREHRENIRGLGALLIVILFAAVLAYCATGCSTVVPRALDTSRQPSFDGNEQNSGVIASTPSGFVVTAHFRERYNALIAVYGADYLPALKPDAGLTEITGGRWLIDRQHMTKFLEMNAWRRAALAPVKPNA